MNRKSLLGLAGKALCAAFLAVQFAAPAAAQANREIVIGATMINVPNFLDWWRDGVNFAVDEINASGGINGAKVRLQLETFNDPAGAVGALKKLTEVDKVSAVLGTHSSGFLAQAGEAKDKNFVLMNIGASAPAIRKYGGSNIFSAIPLGTAQYEAIARAAYKMGYRNIFAAIERTDMGSSGIEVFRKTFEGLGGKIVGTVEHNQTAGDFRSQLLRIRATPHDAVFMITTVADTAQMLKQAAELKVPGPWLSYEVGVGQPVVEVAGKAAEGLVWAAFMYDPNQGSAMTTQWAQRFKQKYGYSPNIYPAVAYDGLRIIAEAMKKSGSTDPAKLIQWLKATPYEGVTGPVKFDKDNMLDQPVRLMTIKDGKFVVCTTCGN